MPLARSLCLQNLAPAPGSPEYLMCVALPGGEPGLCVDVEGKVAWRSEERAACELWVSQDEQLILWRIAGGPPVTVLRGGRSHDVPEARPVVLLDQDQIQVAQGHFRIHLHGPASKVESPRPYRPRRRSVPRAAAALALGAALLADAAAATAERPLQVRSKPPKPVPPRNPESGAHRRPKAVLDVSPVVGAIKTPLRESGEGVLVIVATPWATISVDGKTLGDAPLELRAVEGTYLVKAVHAEQTQVKKVQVSAGQRGNCAFDFAAERGK